MRYLVVPVACAALALAAVSAGAQEYTIREVGFVEVEMKPYRLVVAAKGPSSPALTKQQAKLRGQIADSNIVLVAQTVDATTVLPDKSDPTKLTSPRYWLIAPDDRVIGFNPTTMTNELLNSPLRQQLSDDTRQSLGAVVLLESTDAAANALAKAKAESVIAQINKVRRHLDRSVARDVELLHLPVADRVRERWTLWGLGEETAAPDLPKIAVLFGRLRVAGPLLAGTQWKEEDLFARLVSLGQACEDELDRKEFFGATLPFQWTKEWHGEMADLLQFDPLDREVKAKLAAVLQKPALPESQRTPRKRSFGDFAQALQDENPPAAMEEEVLPRQGMPGLFATNFVGQILFAAGLVGWIALGLGVWILERSGSGAHAARSGRSS